MNVCVAYTMSACEFCVEELKSIDFELENLKLKAKTARDQYITLLADNLKRDHTINELNKQLEMENVGVNFSTFEPILGAEGVNQLENISANESKDSTFILTLLRLLFIGESGLFANMSVAGQKGKQKMPPDKYEVIVLLFKARLQGLENSEKRSKKFNVHIKNCIANEKTKLKSNK